jgi:hypothetical protein
MICRGIGIESIESVWVNRHCNDLFPVGFFLSIGIFGSSTPAAVGLVLLLVSVMPVKAAFFFGILTRFRADRGFRALRGRGGRIEKGRHRCRLHHI